MDLRCVLAAAENEYTTATAQNIKFGIEDIEAFAWIVIDLDLDIAVNALTDDECKSDVKSVLCSVRSQFCRGNRGFWT